MANQRLRLGVAGSRAWRLSLGLLLLPALVACGGGGGLGDVPTAQPISGPLRISAEWLKQQPGRSFGDVSFHLLDAQGKPLASWDGLRVEPLDQGAAPRFSLTAGRAAPDDIYLYVTYPNERLAFAAARLNAARSDDYLMLAVPQRMADVLVVGLARLGSRRGQPPAAGPLCEIDFAAGAEMTYRQISAVNMDVKSAVQLSLAQASSEGVTLAWDERNIGDYNNNSQVEIADITPVGKYFGQQVAGAAVPAELVLVDGDENGEINLADLTPIGRNYLHYIQGFTVYYATGASPQPGDFTSIAVPPVSRLAVWDAATPEQRKQRLHYEYSAGVTDGPNHYYVRAYSEDDGAPSEGPPSNVVTYTATLGNQPPYWESTPGLLSAVGSGLDGIRLSFGKAIDPESGAVSYILRYVLGQQPIGSPGTLSVTIPTGELGQWPPYSWVLTGLTAGQTYTLNLKAQDPEGLSTENDEELVATVPLLAFSDDTWPYQRFDAAHTGTNPACTLTEPLTPAWSADLGWETVMTVPNEPLISSAGWIAAGLGGDSGVRRYDLATGAVLDTKTGLTSANGFNGALFGARWAAGDPSGAALFRDTYPAALKYSFGAAVTAGTLLLGDYLYAADLQGTVHCVMAASGEELWHWPPTPPGVAYYLSPAADAQHLYLARYDGQLDKLDLLTGENAATAQLGANPLGDSVVLDVQHGRLFLAAGGDKLIALKTSDLSLEKNWPMGGLEEMAGTPCVVAQASPPMVVQLLARAIGPTQRWTLQAFRLDDLSDLWTSNGSSIRGGAALTAGQSRLFLLDQDNLLNIIDFAGNLRQSVTLSFPVHSAAVLAPDRLAAVTGTSLSVFKPAESDGPPVWQGTEGIRELEGSYGIDAGTAKLTVKWDYAVDDNAEPVHYVIYYAADAPPELDPPYTGTTLITGIPNTGTTNEYAIYNLDLGTRYYVTVRAYDGSWDETPNVDSNTRWLAVTPPWNREELLLGQDLPAGEVYFMRGAYDPQDAGLINLVYNDAVDEHLTYVFGYTGNWQYEITQLADHPAIAFDPRWSAEHDRMSVGMVGTDDKLALLVRTGANIWGYSEIDDALPLVNPQVTLAYADAPFLAYTQYISGELPTANLDYYFTRKSGVNWDPVAELDSINYCGRDLDVQLTALAAPVVAYQRGIQPDPNRPTPMTGNLWLASDNGLGGFNFDPVDSGALPAQADCGKRVRMAIDSAGRIHLAYLDLNTSESDPTGQLKYAYYDAGNWHIEVVHTFDLSFQTGMARHFTYSELSLGLSSTNQPRIGFLGRESAGVTALAPHEDVAYVWVRDEPNLWHGERLTDMELAFPQDREPCVLVVTPADEMHLFFATGRDVLVPTANRIVHLWRPLPPA